MSVFSNVCWPHICLLLKVSVHILHLLLNGLVCFFLVNLSNFFVNSQYKSFVRWVNCKIFSHSVGCQFTLMIVLFAVQKLWSLIRSYLSILAYVANTFGVLVMKSLPMHVSWMVLTRFCSRIFMVLGLMFKSLIHLELIFV